MKICQKESQEFISCNWQKKKEYRLDPTTGFVKFPFKDRWLDGIEYAFLLRHYKAYSYKYSQAIEISK